MKESLKTWVTAIVCIVASAANGSELAKNPGGDQFAYQELSQQPEVSYRHANERSNSTVTSYNINTIARPVTYTYFSSNIREPLGTHVEVNHHPVVGMQDHFRESYQPVAGQQTDFGDQLRAVPYAPVQAENANQPTYIPYSPPQPVHHSPGHYENITTPVVSGRTVRFPLNTVLPGNSLSFDHTPYPGLLQAVNTFSDLTPARQPKEALVVTHSRVSLPPTHEGVTTASRTRITNQAGYGAAGSFPLREFTETNHRTQGDRGSVQERTQHLRFHQNIDEAPAESFPSFRTGYTKHGHGGGGGSYESGNGEAKEEDHHTTKGGKGEKGYKKDHKHHKGAKGHHDKERDSSEFEENSNEEKKYHKDEGFYGEHHKAEKGGKEKKYGEGGKHKKGHTTHGEHNIIKKDEFIKNTKFYDEDHGGGEHEEHGEFYGRHEEKKGGNKEGGHKESDYLKKNAGKKGLQDKGHVDEEHHGHDSGSGHEEHFEREEEYGGSKGGHSLKKWGHNSGDKH